MKLHELIGNKLLESTITGDVTSLSQLKGKEHQTGEVNVTGDVNLSKKKLVKLPLTFGKVSGYFDCGSNQLTLLDGAPHTVDGSFLCNGNLLTSLEGTPHTVGGGFSCASNQLTSLKGAPHTIGAGFSCVANKLTSLVGIHKIIKKMNGAIYLEGNPIASGGIGLILIDGLTEIRLDQPAFKIINKYLGQGKKGLLLCQEELLDAGLEEYAKL